MQQPPNQQPNTFYPPQQFQPPYPQQWQQPPTMPPPPPKLPRKKRNPWLIVALIVGVLIIGAAIMSNGTKSSPSTQATPTTVTQATTTTVPTNTPTSEPADTPIPTQPSTSLVRTFSGHLSGGNWYDSSYFTVPDNWQVSWTCTNTHVDVSDIVTIAAYDHSGNPIPGDESIAAKGQCSQLAGTGSVQPRGGTIRLHIYAQGDWTVRVEKEG